MDTVTDCSHPSWTVIDTEENMAPQVTESTGNQHMPVFFWTRDHITMQQTSTVCWPTQYTGLKPSVTRSLQAELNIHKMALQNNSYNSKQIQSMRTLPQLNIGHCEIMVATLPLIQNTFKCNTKVLTKHNIKTIGFLL